MIKAGLFAFVSALGGARSCVASDDASACDHQSHSAQRLLVSSDLVPMQIGGAQLWELEQMGFVFGAQTHRLFMHAQFPEGWKKVATDHPLHTDVVDEMGRRRAGIFYRADLCNQRADMTMFARYQIDAFARATDGVGYDVAVTDCGSTVERFGTWSDGAKAGSREQTQSAQRAREKLAAQARAWLHKKRPKWHNPLLYWSEGGIA
jgi:hypothetical protein